MTMDASLLGTFDALATNLANCAGATCVTLENTVAP